MRNSMSSMAAAMAFGAVLGLGPAFAQDAPAEGAVADPFADSDIDISGAGTTVQEAVAFFEALEPGQQEQVVSICTDSAAADEPQAPAEPGAALCSHLAEAGVVEGAPAR